MRGILLCLCCVCLSIASVAHAATLPAPLVDITLPPQAPNSFGAQAIFGPSGLLYAWNGGEVFKQNGLDLNAFTSIGQVGSGSSDPGPLAFSRNGTQILLGNGFGGSLGGANEGLIFGIPAAGGNSSTPVGTVSLHNAFLAAPLGASNSLYFVDVGTDFLGSASRVTVFDSSTGTNVPVIQNIPGASASGMAIDSSNRLYVGIGFGTGVRGQLRTFSLAALTTAYNSSTPVDWSTGAVFNLDDNNSAAGMGIDSRGLLFVGGPQGVTVFDSAGHNRFYDNGGYTVVAVDAAHDRLLITGFGDNQGLYAASTLNVPEPSTAVLAAIAITFLISFRRRNSLSRRERELSGELFRKFSTFTTEED